MYTKELLIFIPFVIQLSKATIGGKVMDLPILMPHVQPTVPETYLCTSFRLDWSKETFVVGFKPNATMHIAHHVLLYGCSLPGAQELVWNCGEMNERDEASLLTAPTCSTGSQIVYAWARNAPELKLPPGVGFRVGGSSPIQYLVLQVHYSDVSPFLQGRKDQSGVILRVTETPQPRAAGVILLGTGGVIRAKATEYMETACEIEEDKEIHPFAFRTHTHSLGRVVTGYRVRRTWFGRDMWTRLGTKDPMKPQMFYPVEDTSVVIRSGEVLAARCKMVSNRTRPTNIGTTNNDEMCNFYLMYWVDGAENLETKFCFSEGPPNYYWHSGTPLLNNVPSRE